MAKLVSGAITKAEINEYLNNYSDFSFELRVLKKLSDLGFDCRHSGVYEDPVTKKSREYDIRAEKKLGFRTIRTAVECKNIRENYPLVAHCVSRSEQESFHDLIVTHEETRSGKYYFSSNQHSSSRVRIRGEESLYTECENVAKSIDQVGKSSSGIVSSDGSVFEKINQALHSAHDLIYSAHYDREELQKKSKFNTSNSCGPRW